MKSQVDTKTSARWPSLEGRMESVLRLCDTQEWDASHAFRVADLALQIYDQLYYRHRGGAQSRELLASAALLHDIRPGSGYRAEHGAVCGTIMEAPLSGFSRREQIIIAQAARCQGEAAPEPGDEGFRDLHRADRKMVKQLAAVIRLADALDCDNRGVVEEVTLRPGGGGLQMVASICGKADMEMETARQRADLFETIYGTLNITTVEG